MDKIYIIAGMPRAGTTFLYYHLQKHPDVFTAFRKETNYFSFHFDKGDKWYLGIFKERKAHQICFDISPTYFMDKESFKRIKKFNPNARVILMVREPVAWILSYYNQVKSFTFRPPSFENFFQEGYQYKYDGGWVNLNMNRGFLKDTITALQDTFGENLLLCNFRLLEKDSLRLLKAIERYCGIRAYFSEGNFSNFKINAGNRKNIKLLEYMMKKKFFVDFCNLLFPRKAVVKLRNFYDGLSAKRGKNKVQEANKNTNTPLGLPGGVDKKLIEDFFKQDSEFINQLFARWDILLGQNAFG
jgi:hypothetical protein